MNIRKIVSVQHQIADIIRSEIISGALPADSKLTQQYLAERFGVSRGSVREVLLILKKEGLTYTKTSTGHYISQPLNRQVNDVLNDVLDKIECFAIDSFKEKSTPEDIEKLDDIVSEMKSHFAREEFAELINLDIDFYKHHIELAGGITLLNVWQPLVQRMRNDCDIKQVTSTIEKYTALLNAIKDKHTQAPVGKKSTVQKADLALSA